VSQGLIDELGVRAGEGGGASTIALAIEPADAAGSSARHDVSKNLSSNW